MSGEYLLREDIDKLINDIYDINSGSLRVVQFRDNSPLQNIGVYEGDTGTLDAILEYYGLLDIDERLNDIVIEGIDVDLTGYVKKSDIVDNTKYDVDLNLNFGLSGFDDNISIDMDIVDHIVDKTINI